MGVTREQIRERDLWRCARCGSATELHVHHRILRSQGGRDTFDNQVTLCAACHEWVHRNPLLAQAEGWLLKANSRPGTVAVRHHAWPAAPIWLRADGTVQLLPDLQQPDLQQAIRLHHPQQAGDLVDSHQ